MGALCSCFGMGKANFLSDEGVYLDAAEAMQKSSPSTGQAMHIF
jgi:hypothetical protein